MRILMLVFNLAEKGTYFRAYHFARELARRRHTATLIYTSPNARARFSIAYEENGRLALVAAPDLSRGSLRSGWHPWAALARSAWLDVARFDIVHAFECRPSVIVPALIARRRAPLVLDWCDWFGRGGSVEERPHPLVRALLRPPETFFEERFRPCADATTVINSVLAAKAVGLGVAPATITLLRNGCDASAWALQTQQAERAALGLPSDTPLIAYVGAIFARDAQLLTHAFDLLYAVRPDARLLVLGYCNIAIENLVQVPEAVLRTGPLDAATLRRYLRAADLGWAPLCDSGANQGRWPLKLSTYMEVGLPFITNTVGDLAAFLTTYPAGLAVPPTPTALAEATLALLADPDRAETLGNNGRRLAKDELSWARITDQLEALYLELI